jgi:putative tryptophan/tyrosine transport system substrate-binding protein
MQGKRSHGAGIVYSSIPRRTFLTVLGGATAWPFTARAQRAGSMRRVGVLMSTPDDSLGQAWLGALTQGLQQLGWEVGHNMQLDIRWGAGDTESFRKYAAELVALAPDVVVATANSIVSDFQQESRTIPIVFVLTIDPVGSGLVESLAHPGGNTTGFTAFDFSMNTKLLELLKEIAPDVKRVAVIRDSTVSAGSSGFAAIQAVAASSGVELTPVGVHDAEEIERGIADFAHGAGDGLIVVGPPSSVNTHRDLIVTLAAQHHLPAVYSTLAFVGNGALVSYGIEGIDQCRRAAGYVDRILKGEKPADLPVQAPTRYALVINLKTAKALGIAVPAMLLATADQVIE